MKQSWKKSSTFEQRINCGSTLALPVFGCQPRFGFVSANLFNQVLLPYPCICYPITIDLLWEQSYKNVLLTLCNQICSVEVLKPLFTVVDVFTTTERDTVLIISTHIHFPSSLFTQGQSLKKPSGVCLSVQAGKSIEIQECRPVSSVTLCPG